MMKTHAINSQTGFCGSSCILLHYLFRNTVVTIFKVVGSKNCNTEQVTTMGAWGNDPSYWSIVAIFWEKLAILTPLE